MTLASEHESEQRCRAEAERDLERLRAEITSRKASALREAPILEAQLWLRNTDRSFPINQLFDLVEWAVDAHAEITRLRAELDLCASKDRTDA